MRVLCITAFLTMACAEKFTMGTGVGMVLEQLDTANFEGGSRGMGKASGLKTSVNVLLNTMAKADKLDDNAKAILDQVSALLQDILDLLVADRDTEQHTLDGITAAVSACVVSTVVDEENRLETATNEARTNHTTCRSSEASKYDTKQTECTEVIDALAALSPLDCDVNVPTLKTKGDAWVTRLHEIKTWFNTASTALGNVQSDCEEATTAHANKKDECDGAQEAFESIACSYSMWTHHRCENQESCYDTAVDTHNGNVATIFPEANQRVEDAKLVTYVKCLVEALRDQANPTMDSMTTACAAKKTDSYASYNNTLPAVPAMAECTPTSHNPDAADWDAIEYAAISSKSPVDDLSIVCNPVR